MYIMGLVEFKRPCHASGFIPVRPLTCVFFVRFTHQGPDPDVLAYTSRTQLGMVASSKHPQTPYSSVQESQNQTDNLQNLFWTQIVER